MYRFKLMYMLVNMYRFKLYIYVYIHITLDPPPYIYVYVYTYVHISIFKLTWVYYMIEYTKFALFLINIKLQNSSTLALP